MTARELFKQAGVTKELYDKFLKPLLLVGLFAPPEELSAAVTLEVSSVWRSSNLAFVLDN